MGRLRVSTVLNVLAVSHSSNEVIEGSQLVNRSSVGSLAFLVWDIIITFDDEVASIWPSPWSFTKVLYYFTRYLAVLVQIAILFVGTELSPAFHFTPHDCFIWQVFQGVSAFLIIIATDLVLVLRVHALYRGNKYIRFFLGFLFLAEAVVMATGLGMALPGIEYDEICRVTQAPTTFLAVSAAPVGFQTILFLMTSWKFVQAVRDGWGDVPLIMLLMRDGTWAFNLLFLMLLGEAIMYGVGSDTYTGVLYGWLLTVFSFCGYRILLNIHHLGKIPREQSVESFHTDPDLHFTSAHVSDQECRTRTSSLQLSRYSKRTFQSGLTTIAEHAAAS